MFFIGAVGIIVSLVKGDINMSIGYVLIAMNGALPDTIKRSLKSEKINEVKN